MTDGSFNELSAHQMGTIEKFINERIERFVNRIRKTDQLMLKLPNAYYKWEGIGLLLSLRSQIDYLLNHPSYYYFLEGGCVEFMDFESTFISDKIKDIQTERLINGVKEGQPERESQLSEILEKWEQYKSNFASDECINNFFLSSSVIGS
ncbi:hypothetical protein KKA14_22335 [bacterium]|nr:hypothetical protein [bacterium]